jgi:tRNA(Arg) A34 adenosine deaminase TadA
MSIITNYPRERLNGVSRFNADTHFFGLEGKLVRFAYKNLHDSGGRSKHLSFLVRRNKVICIGYNSYVDTHTLAHKFGYWLSSIHSELSMINNYQGRLEELRNMKVYNIRINNHNLPAIAKPCGRCIELLSHFNIRKVFYTTDEFSFREMYI